jgi:D-apionolactonase
VSGPPAAGPRWSLRAGPLSLVLDGEDGSLRGLRLGAREVLRRVYVTVRDGRWLTIPGTISDIAVEEGAARFSAVLTGEHAAGEVHFRWRGRLEGAADGTVRFELDGEALTSFEKNRIGLCVLHPVDECAGRACRVEHTGGAVADGEFPYLIAPESPFTDIRALTHDVAPGLRAEVRLEGEAFEMEDQRNWSDASYKTYPTPQSLPKPVKIAAGTRVQQSVTLRLVPAPGVSVESGSAAPDPIAFEPIDGAPALPLPRLGTALCSWRSEPLLAEERARLAALNLGHLRADLVPSRPDFAPAFALAAAEAAALGLPLELAVSLSPDAGAAAAELDLVCAAWSERRPSLAAVVIVPLGRGPTTVAQVALARARLGPLLGNGAVPLAGGSNAHFTEVNRQRAVAEVVDVLSFPSTPLVHLADDDTLIENLAALPWIADTARSFAGARTLALSPVTLRRLPAPPPAPGAPSPGGAPYTDSRQGTALVAAWTACHLAAAARAGVRRLTYFQATGPAGLMPAMVAGEGRAAGTVYPVYDVVAAVAGLPGARVVVTRSEAPLLVDGLVLHAPGTTRILLANFSRQARRVRLPAAWAAGQVLWVAGDEPAADRRAAASGDTLVLDPRVLISVDVQD